MQQDTICVQCGDKGFTNAFVYCVKCLQFAVHRYCLSVVPKSVDEFVRWVCSDCEMEVVEHCPKRLKKKLSIDNMTLTDRINRITRKKHELQPSDSPAPVPVPKNISAKSTKVLSTKAALHGIDAINAPSVMTKRSTLLKKEVMQKKSIEKEIETPNNRKKRHVAEAIVENEEAKPPQKRKSKHVSKAKAEFVESDDKKEVKKKKSIEKEIETPKNRKKRHVAEAIVENEEAKPPQKRKSKHVSKAKTEFVESDDKVNRDSRYKAEHVRDYLRSQDPGNIKALPPHLADATMDVGRSWTLDLEGDALNQSLSDNVISAIVHFGRATVFLSRFQGQIASLEAKTKKDKKERSQILKKVQDKVSSFKSRAESAEQKSASLLAQNEEFKKVNAEQATALETLNADLKNMTTKMMEIKAEKERSANEVVEWKTKLDEVKTKLEVVEADADSDAVYAYICAYGEAMRSLRRAKADEAFLSLKAEFEAYVISHPIPGLPLPIGDLGLTLPTEIDIEKDEASSVAGEQEVIAEETPEVEDVTQK
ncbi:hypothetical protein ACS0TY_036697 [Phlomoides rotata]